MGIAQCPSTDEWIKTKCIVFIKGILLSHKEEWSPDKCYLNQPCTHAKWKKPDTKDHILYDAIYMKYTE